jgi:hypothetical protein
VGKKNLFRLMIWGSYKRPVLKILVILILFISILMVGITAALQFPEIQTRVTQQLAKYLSNRIGLPVQVGYVNIYWFNQIHLEDLLVKDTENDTLIYIQSARLNYNTSTFLNDRDITFNKAIVEKADVRVVRNAPDGRFNINIFDDAMKDFLGSNRPDSLKGTFLIKEIELYNSDFILSDPQKDSIRNKFNYNQFRIQDINAKGENLKARGKDFQIQFNTLSGIDSATQTKINNITGFYQITKNSMVFRTFDIDLGRSNVEASFVFQFDSIQQMKEFNELVTIIADIKDSRIYSRDLGNFATVFKKYFQFYKLNGFFSGTINRFRVNNFDLALGSVSRLKGSASFAGLPDVTNTFIDLKVENSLLKPEDLVHYAGEKMIQSLKKFGNSSFNGRFIGFPVDFVADAEFHTQIGFFDSDINLKLDQTDNLPHYSGSIIAQGLDLGLMLENEKMYQQIDLNGRIEGKGFYKADADFLLDAVIENIGFLGYNYQNILIDGRLASEIFNGMLDINDPNLEFEMNGEIDLREGYEMINIAASIDTAVLHHLNITEKPASLSTQIHVNLKGLDIDSISGRITAPETHIMYDNREAQIIDLKLISENTDSLSYLELSSQNLDCHISGNFRLNNLFKDIPQIISEYYLILKNNSNELGTYYANKPLTDSTNYLIDYNVSLFDINSIGQLILPQLYISKNTYISGDLIVGPTSLISLYSDIDTLQYGGIKFYNNSLNVNGAKLADSSLVDATINFFSETQENAKEARTSNFEIDGDWDNKHIDLTFNIDQVESGNEIHIVNTIDLFPDSTVIKFQPSELIILNSRWKFASDNRIDIRGKEIHFSNVHLSNEKQYIELVGQISEDTSKSIHLNIKDFVITNLNPILPRDFHGILNGYTTMKRYYQKPIIISDLIIHDLIFERFPSGDVHASSQWDATQQRMGITFEVFKEEDLKVIDINGNYYPERENNKIDLLATFNNANINFIEPFYEDLISDLDGKTNGSFSIGGNLRRPIVNGQAYVNEGKITIDYLKASYDFSGNVMFTENRISARDLQLKDKFSNSGTLNGGIIHDYFRNIQFDLRGEFENLLVLNTAFDDNKQFYGTAFGTGNMHITGREKNINIEVDATTNNGTKFYIPLSGDENEVVQENYIQFAKIGDESSNKDEKESNVLKLSGIKLDFDLEVTQEAYCEIIFDQKAGDIIRGRGNGELSLSMDTKGEFNMFGDYEIQSGGYNFTLYNVINKEFSIEPNSRISWSGDPYAAQLDLTATYRQLAALAPLFAEDSSAYNNPEARRKYPTNVVLHLTGPLMTPEIAFDIDINDYPKHLVINGISFETVVSSFKSEIYSNEQELKRQVFSLIILRKFAEQGSFSVGNSFGNSVSEFISNQLSYWITQIDENLEIDLDLGTLDQNAFNTFQYRLSYSFNDGRFRVTRSGNISNEDNPNDLSNIIGDWTLEYLLSQDGKYRAKMYNRFNYNSLYGDSRSTTTATAGFSLMHTQSFNKFRDLFKSNRKKRKKQDDYIEFDEGILPSNESQGEEGDPPSSSNK